MATRRLDMESATRSDDLVELRLWLRLLTCTTLIERELSTRLSRQFDITLARFDVLAQLRRTDGGLTMGQISKRMMVTHGNVTGLVDRLVRDALVVRAHVEGNRRAILVQLTVAGRFQFDKMAAAHHRWVCDMLGNVDSRTLKSVFGALDKIKVSVLEELETVPSS